MMINRLRQYATSTKVDEAASAVKATAEKTAATLTSTSDAADAKAKSMLNRLGPSGAFNILAGTGLGAFLLSKEYLILDAHFAVALSFGAFLTLAITKGGPMIKGAMKEEIKVPILFSYKKKQKTKLIHFVYDEQRPMKSNSTLLSSKLRYLLPHRSMRSRDQV